MTTENVEGFLDPPQEEEDEYDVTQTECMKVVSQFNISYATKRGDQLTGLGWR